MCLAILRQLQAIHTEFEGNSKIRARGKWRGFSFGAAALHSQNARTQAEVYFLPRFSFFFFGIGQEYQKEFFWMG